MAEPGTSKDTPIAITAHELPLYCPRPDAPLWARHPRVFLNVTSSGDTVCPYCSAHYVFTGELPKGEH